MRIFVCSSCQAITKRLEGALAPAFCAFCRSTELFEPGEPAPRKMAVLEDADGERPCERGEPCARLSGKPCPGGRGC